MDSPAPNANVEELIRTHWRRLAGFVRSLGVPGHDVDDRIQETWVRVLRHAAKWDGGVPWVLAIARNVVHDWRAKKRPVLDGEVVALAAAPTQDEPRAEAAKLGRCLDRLKAANGRFHAAVVAFYYDARTDDDVAAEHGVAAATVRSGRHKAVAALRKCLGVSAE